MEFWDIYDADRQKMGRTVMRGRDQLAAGEYHLVVDAVIMNSRGELLLQKRAHDKEIYPDCWMFTGGSAIAGETSGRAVARETLEELGIAIQTENTRLLRQMIQTNKNAIRDIYLVEQDAPLETLTLQQEEVQDAMWILPEAILADEELLGQVSNAVWFDALIGEISRLSGEKRVKNGRYRHFKGNEYMALGIAVHSETLCPMVIYQALYGARGVWVRPVAMWNEQVRQGDIMARRFTYIGEK